MTKYKIEDVDALLTASALIGHAIDRGDPISDKMKDLHRVAIATLANGRRTGDRRKSDEDYVGSEFRVRERRLGAERKAMAEELNRRAEESLQYAKEIEHDPQERAPVSVLVLRTKARTLQRLATEIEEGKL